MVVILRNLFYFSMYLLQSADLLITNYILLFVCLSYTNDSRFTIYLYSYMQYIEIEKWKKETKQWTKMDSGKRLL